jgi:hypothetical protein
MTARPAIRVRLLGETVERAPGGEQGRLSLTLHHDSFDEARSYRDAHLDKLRLRGAGDHQSATTSRPACVTCPRPAHSVSWSCVAIERSSSVDCALDPFEPASGQSIAAFAGQPLRVGA